MIAVIDTETTGLTAGVHEIVQISVIPLSPTFEPIGRFISYIRPTRPNMVEKEAFEVNGLTIEGLLKEPLPSQVRGSLLEWKKDFTDELIEPLGHNYAGFDAGFLRCFLGTELYKTHFSHRNRDSQILALSLKDAGLINPESCSLTMLLKYFNIERKIAHDAYEDALATLMLYKKLISIIKGA